MLRLSVSSCVFVPGRRQTKHIHTLTTARGLLFATIEYTIFPSPCPAPPAPPPPMTPFTCRVVAADIVVSPPPPPPPTSRINQTNSAFAFVHSALVLVHGARAYVWDGFRGVELWGGGFVIFVERGESSTPTPKSTKQQTNPPVHATCMQYLI